MQRIILKVIYTYLIERISKDDRCRKKIENRAMIERAYKENGKLKNKIKIIKSDR